MQDNTDTTAPKVKPVAFGKPAKFFRFELADTKNRHGCNLDLDVEYTLDHPAGSPPVVVIETLTINGHDVSQFLEQYAALSNLEEKIEAAILESLKE